MPSKTSVYGNNDSLETRGATWNLLRYLADHRGSSDGDTWSQLVNTSRTGQTNLAHVFGTSYMTQIRDWATSVFADDVAGVTDARFLAPSWNMRDIFPHLVNSSGTPLGRYPLAVVPLSDATPANLSIYSGGAAYLRFSVPANASGVDRLDAADAPGVAADPVHAGAHEVDTAPDERTSRQLISHRLPARWLLG